MFGHQKRGFQSLLEDVAMTLPAVPEITNTKMMAERDQGNDDSPALDLSVDFLS